MLHNTQLIQPAVHAFTRSFCTPEGLLWVGTDKAQPLPLGESHIFQGMQIGWDHQDKSIKPSLAVQSYRTISHIIPCAVHYIPVLDLFYN